MKSISLKQMLEELTQSILNKKEPDQYFYRQEFEEGVYSYTPITEVDLLDSRFKTIDNDFSEYEWELENSRIYKED